VIGLYLVSLVFDLLGIITRKKEYVTFAFIMLIFSGISVLFALASGVLEEYTIIIPQAAESTFETHETLAFVTASLILLQVFWRIGLKNRLQGKTRMIFLALAIAGLISLFIGTYLEENQLLSQLMQKRNPKMICFIPQKIHWVLKQKRIIE
jgi:uncharacterized membrane protein